MTPARILIQKSQNWTKKMPKNRIISSETESNEMNVTDSSHMHRAKGQAVSLVECDRTKKKMSLTGLEPRTFCYLDKCPSQLD